MTIHFIHPFSLEMNYGKEINKTFSLIPDEDWLCIMDWDAAFIIPNSIPIIYEYVNRNLQAGLLTCYSNRSGSIQQRPNSCYFSSNLDYKHNYDLAIKQTEKLYQTTELTSKIGGFLMVVSKATWNQIQFPEHLKVADVDRNYCERLIHKGKQILRMDGLFIWHSYRFWKSKNDTSHLL